MTDYNWDQEYKYLWWRIRKHGYDPEDAKVEAFVSDLFDNIWHSGFSEGFEHGYESFP